MKIVLFNTSIITCYGHFSFVPATLAQVQEQIKNSGSDRIISAIGHQATAEILSELLNIPISVNRIRHEQATDELGIVFKLKGRVKEGRILNREEIEAVGYEFGFLTRVR